MQISQKFVPEGSIDHKSALIHIINLVPLRWQVTSCTNYHPVHCCIQVPNYGPQWFNTLRPRQDGCHFADAIFRCIFFNENCCILIKLFRRIYASLGLNELKRHSLEILFLLREKDDCKSDSTWLIESNGAYILKLAPYHNADNKSAADDLMPSSKVHRLCTKLSFIQSINKGSMSGLVQDCCIYTV